MTDANRPSASETDLKARILAAAREEPSPTRAGARWRTGLALGLGVAVMVLVFVAIGGVRLTGRPPELVFATALGALVLAFGALVLAFGRGRSMVGRRTSTLVWTIIAVPLLLFGWKLGASASCELDAWWPERPGLRCLLWSLLMGGALLASVLFVRRGTVARAPALVGGASGVAVGAAAWVLTDLWCPVGHAAHLALGHVLPMLVLGIVGALVGHGVLRVRA
ncbi:MAG: DUF1109 family protein [Deltaproteobacteria bacterium]|nr:DUF1109 family protein [Deltaproteobacteria bacterium]